MSGSPLATNAAVEAAASLSVVALSLMIVLQILLL
jgi:hypothetical protein